MDDRAAELGEMRSRSASLECKSAHSKNFSHKLLYRRNRTLRLIQMRAVSTICQQDGAHRPFTSSFDPSDLFRGSVLIVLALNQQYGHINLWQILFNIP